MLVEASFVADARYLRKRARIEAEGPIRVVRPFLVPEGSTDGYRYVVRGAVDFLFGFEADWYERDGSFWRIAFEGEVGEMLDAKALELRKIADTSQPGRAAPPVPVPESDLRELLESNVEELHSLVQEWVDDNLVAIEGRIALRGEVPVLTEQTAIRHFRRHRSNHTSPLAQEILRRLPECVWLVDGDLAQALADDYGVAEADRQAAATYAPPRSAPFDRDLALVRRLCADLITSGTKVPGYRSIRIALEENAGIDRLLRLGTAASNRSSSHSLTPLDAIRERRSPSQAHFPAAGSDATPIVTFGTTVKGIARTIEVAVATVDRPDAAHVASIRREGCEPIELFHMEDTWLAPILHGNGMGQPLRIDGADRDASFSQRSNETYAAWKRASDLGYLTGAEGAEDIARALTSFAEDHLVSIDGVVHARCGEPFLSAKDAHVHLVLPAVHHEIEGMRTERLPRSFEQGRNVVALANWRSLPLLGAAADFEIDLHDVSRPRLDTRQSTACVVAGDLLRRIPVSVPAGLSRIRNECWRDVGRASALAAGRTPDGNLRSLRSSVSTLVAELTSRTVYGRIVATREFQAATEMLALLDRTLEHGDEAALGLSI